MNKTNELFEITDEVSEVVQWAERLIKSGQYPDSTGRFRIRALEALIGVMLPEEPRTAQHIFDNIDSLTDRWATKNKMAGGTPKTYKSRASGLLDDYLKWKADPSGFKLDRSSAPKKAPKEKAAKQPPAKPDEPSAVEVWETINLGNGKIFKFNVSDITMKDAGRIAYALAARATDFDPQVGFAFSRRAPDAPGTELGPR